MYTTELQLNFNFSYLYRQLINYGTCAIVIIYFPPTVFYSVQFFNCSIFYPLQFNYGTLCYSYLLFSTNVFIRYKLTMVLAQRCMMCVEEGGYTAFFQLAPKIWNAFAI